MKPLADPTRKVIVSPSAENSDNTMSASDPSLHLAHGIVLGDSTPVEAVFPACQRSFASPAFFERSR